MTEASPRQRSSVLLVESRRQARKVRWICWGSVVWAIAWLVWGADIGQTYDLSLESDGIVPPVEEGWSWAMEAGLAALGLLPLAGLAFYVRRYIIRLVRYEGGVQVVVIGWWNPRAQTFPIEAFEGSTEHEGRTYGHISVNAPWITLRIGGRRYIVDGRSERLDRRGLARLVREGREHRTRKGVTSVSDD